jgi:hypothetical protein
MNSLEQHQIKKVFDMIEYEQRCADLHHERVYGRGIRAWEPKYKSWGWIKNGKFTPDKN